MVQYEETKEGLDNSKLLTFKQAAEYLGITAPLFRKLIYSKSIPFVRMGFRTRFIQESQLPVLVKLMTVRTQIKPVPMTIVKAVK